MAQLVKVPGGSLAADSPDARRIAACLKACEGIPTEKLEDRIIIRLVAACIHVDDAEIREILNELRPKPQSQRPPEEMPTRPRAR